MIKMQNTHNSQNIQKRRDQAVPRSPFHVTPFAASRAKGALLYDVDGNEYIDFTGGIGTVNAGHCPDEVVAAIKNQSEQFLHTCFNIMTYEPYIALAEKINAITPGHFEKQTMFFNSGAEAVENAIKIARYATGRPAVISFEHAFHGRTLLTMSLTSKVKPYKFGFGPFAPETYRAEFPYPYRMPASFGGQESEETYFAYFEQFFKNHVAAENVAAIIVEPILGEGGFVVPPAAFLPALKKICVKYGIVFIADEIQTGFCRTGKMFAVEHLNLEPDLLILGKSLASGMPLSAVCGKKELMDAPHIGGLGGTYAGNPVACSAALATIGIYERDNLAERAMQIGKKVFDFWRELQKEHAFIGDVRGQGAMIGIEFVKDRVTKTPNPEKVVEVIKICQENGLIIMSAGTYGNVLRTLMPLVITDAQIEKSFEIISCAIKEGVEV
jgi:4-aminobutyrate aminotransferase / (S)-3-amino-2-methylpropionate transaminase / 5-aminovalerate transaminase